MLRIILNSSEYQSYLTLTPLRPPSTGGGDDDPPQPARNGLSIPPRPFANLNETEVPQTSSRRSSVSEDTEVLPSKVPSTIQPLDNNRSLTTDHNESVFNSDCSNSSWAEMSSYIVGSYQMFPITRDTKVLFIMKYLRPVGEYQECLAHVFEYKALDLIFHYINVRKTCHARLSFEALRFLGSLLFHKKFCLEFVNRKGVQRLLQVSLH